MDDIDLIPASYRRERQLRERLRGFAALIGVVLVAIVALRVGLSFMIGLQKPALVRLQQHHATIARERQRIETLRVAHERTEQRLHVFEALHGTDVSTPIARAIDQSLNEGVWLQHLRYARTGEYVDVKRDAPPARGSAPPAGAVLPTATTPGVTVLPLPRDDGKPGPSERGWRTTRSLEISGRATDHASLTDFLRALGVQPGVADVRLLNTATHAIANGEIVEFTAIAALGAAETAK